MSTELFFGVLVFIGLTLLRVGIPLLLVWLLGKALRYLQTIRP
jgi:hypothetical protein